MRLRLCQKIKYERLFFFLWGCYAVIYYFLCTSELSRMYNLSVYLLASQCIFSALLICSFLIYKRLTRENFCRYAAYLFLVFLIEIHITNGELMACSLFIVCMPAIDFKRFVKYDATIKTVFAIVIITLCLLGLVDNYIQVRQFANKQSLGFSHPNQFGMFVYATLVEWLYVWFDKMRRWKWTVILGVGLAVFVVAVPRTSAIAFLCIFIMFILARRFPGFFGTKLVRAALTGAAPLMAAVSLLTAYFYNTNNPQVLALNKMLSGRIRCFSEPLIQYGVKLFGQEIVTVSTRTAQVLGVRANPLDNAYIRCLLLYGLIYFVFFCIAYMVVVHHALRRDIPLALMCVFFLILGLGETYTLNLVYNSTLFCLLGIGGILDHKEDDAVKIGPMDPPFPSKLKKP